MGSFVVNLQDTTIHGLYYLSRSKSKKNIVFWVAVTIATICYTGIEVTSEMRKMLAETRFDVRYRCADFNELLYPLIGIRFANWWQVVDWKKAEQLAVSANLTESEYVRWFNGMFNGNLMIKRSTAEESSVMRKMGQIYGEKFDRYENDTWGSFLHFSLSIIGISIDDSGLCRTLFYWSFPPTLSNATFCHCNMDRPSKYVPIERHKVEIRLRMPKYKVTDSKFPGTQLLRHNHISNLSTEAPLRLFLSERLFGYDREFHWYMRNVKHRLKIDIKPELSNYPSKKKFLCKNNDTFSARPGNECFTWRFSINPYNVRHGKEFLQAESLPAMRKNDNYEQIEMYLHFPPLDQWIVREFVPTFDFYTFVAKIGGTVGLWTGASIVSLIHLMKIIVSKLFSVGSQVHPIVEGTVFPWDVQKCDYHDFLELASMVVMYANKLPLSFCSKIFIVHFIHQYLRVEVCNVQPESVNSTN